MSSRSVSCVLRYGKSALLGAQRSSGQCGALMTKLHKVNLTATRGQPDPNRVKPWPYKEKPFNMFRQLFDTTLKRIGDNSKVIVVDGNIAVGKTDFAEKIANEFDLKYVPDVTFDELFDHDGFDIRELDEQLPENLRTCDLVQMLSATDPKKALNFGNTQCSLYFARLMNYVGALEHVLNTGQGVVVERGVFSDLVFTDTLRKYGFFSKAGYEFYRLVRDNSICEVWNPHVFIYLDAPISFVRGRINKRGVPYEVDSPVLTDDFLAELQHQYKNKLLPSMEKSSVVMKYDATDLPDLEMIVEDLEELDLDTPHPGKEEMFKYWTSRREDDWHKYRMILNSKWQWYNLLSKPVPWDAPEMVVSGDDIKTYTNVVREHPALKYQKGYDPAKHSVLLKW